jgi:hypothetical protein
MLPLRRVSGRRGRREKSGRCRASRLERPLQCRSPSGPEADEGEGITMAIATKPPVERREAPAVSTVHLTDEGLRHTRCGEALAFLRRRHGLELDFHCRVCHEHISLTEYALGRIPTSS